MAFPVGYPPEPPNRWGMQFGGAIALRFAKIEYELDALGDCHSFGEGGMAQDQSQAKKKSIFSRLPRLLNSWLALIVAGLAILGAMWGAVQFFNPLKSLDITVV